MGERLGRLTPSAFVSIGFSTPFLFRMTVLIDCCSQPDLGQATPDVNPIDMVGCPKERQAVLNFFPTVRRVALRGLMCYFSWGVGHGFF